MTSETQRILLDCSLAELSARRLLKESQENDFNDNINIYNCEPFLMRRVYLNKTERDTAAQLPEIVLKKYFRSGEFVHIPMTRDERTIIDQFKRFNKKMICVDADMCQEDLQFLAE